MWMSQRPSYWSGVLLFVSVLGCLMFWSLFGVDVADTGFFLFYQAGILREGLQSHMSLTWLSNQLGSLWLMAPFGGHLLWVRFGSALLLSTAATFSFLTWARFCQVRERWYIWVVAFLAICLLEYVRVLHRYSLPLVFLSVALFLRCESCGRRAPGLAER